jgi:hypothetical protein
VGPRVRARLPPDPPLPAPMVVDCVPQSVGSGLGRLLCSRRGRLDRCQEPLLFGVGATPLLCAYAVWTPRRKVCVGVGLGFWSALLGRRRFSSRSSTAQVIVGLAAVSVSCTRSSSDPVSCWSPLDPPSVAGSSSPLWARLPAQVGAHSPCFIPGRRMLSIFRTR